MSATEPQKTADAPAAGTTHPAPAPIEPVTIDKPVTPTADAPKSEEVKPEGEAAAPVEEKKEEEEEEKKEEAKPEEKPVEPIYSGALGYKAPGLKNAFRFSKKYFWFGEEPVPAAKLTDYLRGEKPEIAHPVAAWSSQTGKGLLYFVKHADKKETPAGVLNLAYATDLAKDGNDSFHMKISGHKHTFEAQSAAERDGWYMAVEKAMAEAKEAKEGIESSEGYKEQKEKIGKPATLAAAPASTPKKSTDAAPKPAETTDAAAPAAEEPAAAPVRAGSSSSSSSDEEKKAKKAKSKSRSVSRGKRASIFGGILGKKDKGEAKAEQKKEEHKSEGESKAEPEVKEETPAAAPVAAPATETTTAAPVEAEEPKTDATTAPIVAAPVEESKPEEAKTPAEEKPKPTKRSSIFGTVFNKVRSPTSEKKEADLVPAVPPKDSEPAPEASKPLEEAEVAVPTTIEPVSEPTAKTDEAKPAETKPVESKPAESTPSKEKDHFSFGRFFGSKDRAKSPAAAEKAPASEPAKVDAVAPKIEDPAASTSVEPAVAAPDGDKKEEPVAAPAQDKENVVPVKKEETPKEETPKKRGSIFGSLGRSLSKATKGSTPKETKKETATPTTVTEAAEPKDETSTAPLAEEKKDEKKEETPVTAAPAEKSIGDVVPEAVTVGEAPKSNPAVSTTA